MYYPRYIGNIIISRKVFHNSTSSRACSRLDTEDTTVARNDVNICDTLAIVFRVV